jgi:hypothetical protein
VNVPKEKRNKLDDISIKCQSSGYSENQSRVMNISYGNVFNSRSVTFMELNGYEENTMKISQFEDIKQENLGPRSTNQVPGRQTATDDTIMDGPSDTDVPHVDPEVQNSSYGELYNFGNATPRRPKATA